MTNPLLEQHQIKPLSQGKVRDLYLWQEELWIVTSDRISAFDVPLNPPIPGKGQCLTQISRQWFELTESLCPHHVLSYDFPKGIFIPEWEGRLTRAKKLTMFPVECVARGYLAGSGWKEYIQQGTVGGWPLPQGLCESALLPEPLFTPATKATEGHDINLTPAEAIDLLGKPLYQTLKDLTLTLYQWAQNFAAQRGILVADTKLEFGKDPSGTLYLADEVLTPDSSRFWPANHYTPGQSQPSLDKQYVRDYLETLDWDKKPPAPTLPPEVVEKTQKKYEEVRERLRP